MNARGLVPSRGELRELALSIAFGFAASIVATLVVAGGLSLLTGYWLFGPRLLFAVVVIGFSFHGVIEAFWWALEAVEARLEQTDPDTIIEREVGRD